MDNHLHISEKEWNEIEAFLAGRLDEVGEKGVQQQVDTDEVFRKKVETVQELSLGIEEAGLLAHLKATHKKAFPGAAPAVAARKVFSLKKWLIAASVLVAVISGVFYIIQNGNLFDKYYTPDEGLPVTMGDATEETYRFYDGMIDYKEGKYEEAVKKWQVVKKHSDSDTVSYYLALAYLAQKKCNESAPLLQEVSVNPSSVFKQKATWYLALSYLQCGDMNKAGEQLKMLPDNTSASELLKKITDKQ